MTYYQQINGTENTNDQAAESENAPVQMRNQPKLIISNYSISPKTVEAGGDFNLAFTLYNTNNKNSIYNLKVSIDLSLIHI